LDVLYEAMLDRVEVNVVHVSSQIAAVADRMLPEAALPDAAFALARSARRNALAEAQPARECCLDQPPACREMAVASGQRPQRMKVIRQYHDPVDREGMAMPGVPERRPQQSDIVGKQRKAAICEV
jgi:hypothetical protein